MADRIDIEVADKISASIAKKLAQIAKAASDAAIAEQRLATATARTEAAQRRSNGVLIDNAAKKQRLNKATTQAAVAEQRLAKETANATNARARAQASEIRLNNLRNKTTKSTNSLATGLETLAKRYLAIETARRAIVTTVELADAYTLLENRLKTVTNSQEQLNVVVDEVFDIARDTRTEIDATAKAFVRFDKAIEQLGGSQRETLELTETINKALKVGGLNTQEQAAALLQLSQAFNKGKLDGDEFRTVMETMPDVVDAIAKQLNVTRGELLKLAPEGKITAQVMHEALGSAADEIDKKFSELKPTVSEAFTTLRNSATRAVGELDDAVEGTEALAEVILNVADAVDEMSQVIGPAFELIKVGADGAVFAFDTLYPAISSVVNVMGDFNEIVTDTFGPLDELTTKLNNLSNAYNIIKAFKSGDVTKGLQGIADITISALPAQDEPLRPADPSKRTTGSQTKKLTDLEKAIKKIKDETVGAQKEIETAIVATNSAYKDGIISLDNYNKRISDLKNEAAELRLELGEGDFADVVNAGLGKITEGFQNMETSVSESLGNIFTTMTDGFAESFGQAIVYGEDFGESMREVARGALAEFISQMTKAFIQQQLLGSAVGASGGGGGLLSAGLGIASSFFGGGGAAAGVIGSASGIGGGFAGFADGGYTGSGSNTDVAGVVHKNEFVMDAKATQRIGLGNLQAMKNGASPSTVGTASPAPAPQTNLKVVNLVDPQMVTEAMSSSAGEEAILNTISNNPEYIQQVFNNA